MLIYGAVPLFSTTGVQFSFETSLINFDAVVSCLLKILLPRPYRQRNPVYSIDITDSLHFSMCTGSGFLYVAVQR